MWHQLSQPGVDGGRGGWMREGKQETILKAAQIGVS